MQQAAFDSFSSVVQGGTFRPYMAITFWACAFDCVQSKATELGLTGWVRNRRDGRVEVSLFMGGKDWLQRSC